MLAHLASHRNEGEPTGKPHACENHKCLQHDVWQVMDMRDVIPVLGGAVSTGSLQKKSA